MTFDELKDLFDEWNDAGCDVEGLEAYVFSLENTSHYLETELYLMYGFISGHLAAVEQTRQACFKAVCNQCAEGKGHGCNVCFLKSAIMQAEVE